MKLEINTLKYIHPEILQTLYRLIELLENHPTNNNFIQVSLIAELMTQIYNQSETKTTEMKIIYTPTGDTE